MKVIVTKNYDEMSEKAAEILINVVKNNPSAVLGLATGGTPVGAYKNLVEWYNAGDLEGAKAYVTKYVCDTLNAVNEQWWAFAWELVGGHYDGIKINEDGSSTTLGYPTDWLIEVGYGQTSLDDIAALAKP